MYAPPVKVLVVALDFSMCRLAGTLVALLISERSSMIYCPWQAHQQKSWPQGFVASFQGAAIISVLLLRDGPSTVVNMTNRRDFF
jgi:hypothetical protein